MGFRLLGRYQKLVQPFKPKYAKYKAKFTAKRTILVLALKWAFMIFIGGVNLEF